MAILLVVHHSRHVTIPENYGILGPHFAYPAKLIPYKRFPARKKTSSESCILLWAGFYQNKGFESDPMFSRKVKANINVCVLVCVCESLHGLLCLARCLFTGLCMNQS